MLGNNENTISAVELDKQTSKIDRVLKYLKSVEEVDSKNLKGLEQNTLVGLKKPEEGVVFGEIKSKMMSQRIELEEMQRMQDLLRFEVKRLKEELKHSQEQHSKTLKEKLSLQRSEYEISIKRQLEFIDKLMAEKTELAAKAADLSDQVKNIDKKIKEKKATMEEQMKSELKQQKEMLLAQEKIKREKWMSEKTKLIKDNTIKGLEPEIQKMLAQQKQDLRLQEERLRELFNREKDEILSNHESQIELIKQKLKAEKEKAAEDEREFIRQRYQKQYDQDILEFQNQKKRMQMEFDEEKAKLAKTLKDDFESREQLYKKQLEEQQQNYGRLKLDHMNTMEESKRRHISEMRLLEEKFRLEKEEWQAQFISKQTKQFQEAEKNMQVKLRQERDAEIDRIVQKLEADNSAIVEELDQKHQLKLESLKEQHELGIISLNERIKSLSISNEELNTKISILSEHNKKHEESLMKLRNELEAKESAIRQQNFELEQFKVEKQVMKEEIRREFREELSSKDYAFESLHERYTSMQREVEKMQKQHADELALRERQKQDTVSMIEEQVMNKLQTKDEIIQRLKAQLEDSTLKVVHMEHLLEKQRKVRKIY